jgi:hypothetical protein
VVEQPELPAAESYIGLLEAFIAVLAVHAGGNHLELDHYYLSHLRLSGMPDYPDEQVNLAAVIEAAQYRIGKIREARASGRSQFRPRHIGRILYVFFRDERLTGIESLNEVLRPYLPVFLRIAARGHYLREHRPVRELSAEHDYARPRPPLPPPVVVGETSLATMLDPNYEFSMLLDFQPQRVLYPLGPYPVIREFAAMVSRLKPSEQWAGRYFFGYSSEGSRAFNFYRRADGVVVSFSAAEWGGPRPAHGQGLRAARNAAGAGRCRGGVRGILRVKRCEGATQYISRYKLNLWLDISVHYSLTTKAGLSIDLFSQITYASLGKICSRRNFHGFANPAMGRW